MVITLVFFYVAKVIPSVSVISYDVYTLSVLCSTEVINQCGLWLELIYQVTFPGVALALKFNTRIVCIWTIVMVFVF